MSASLDARRYVEHLRASGALAHDVWPSSLVATFGAAGRRGVRRRRATATPFGALGRTAHGTALLNFAHVGAPATAVAVECLAELGVTRMVVVGRVGVVTADVGPSDPRRIVIGSATGDDATSVAYGRSGTALPDGRLTDQLAAGLDNDTASHEVGRCFSTDVPFLVSGDRLAEAVAAGHIDMEATTLFTVAASAGIALAMVGIESDVRSASAWSAHSAGLVDDLMNQTTESCVSLLERGEG